MQSMKHGESASDAPLVGFYVLCATKYYVFRRIQDTCIPRLNTVGLQKSSCRGKGKRKVVSESTEGLT